MAKSSGFAEGSPGFAASERKWVRLKVGQDGRLLVPADLRDRTGIERGGSVIAEVRDGALVIEPAGAWLDRAQAIARKYDRGQGSPVDELIAERRAEAARE